jgi:hypothetical protein
LLAAARSGLDSKEQIANDQLLRMEFVAPDGRVVLLRGVWRQARISGKLKWPTLRAKLYRPGPDTVEQVAAKGRSSGESHEQKREGMNSTKKTARIAGLLYLVNGVTGFFSIIYVPIRLIVSGNAAATATTFSLPRGFSASASSQN